jgi:hypothetical protein
MAITSFRFRSRVIDPCLLWTGLQDLERFTGLESNSFGVNLCVHQQQNGFTNVGVKAEQ